MQGKHGARLKINHSWCIKLTRQVSYPIPKPITAPGLYFARDFLSNHRSNVRSRANRIFSRSAFLERKLGVSVFSFLFMWGGILPVENDFEWQSGFGDFLSSFFHWSRIASFPFSLPFDLWSGILPFVSFVLFFIFIFLFSFFPFLPFLSLHFSFPIPFFGKSGFSILFAFPWGDSAVLCFGGKNEDSLFIGQGSKRSKVVFQWGLLSCEPNLDIWGETNLGVKVSISGRASILFHKARVTMMIWK